MPLNLLDVDGQIKQVTLDYGDESYLVYRRHPAFDWLWHVCLSVAAMSSAISILHEKKVNPGDYISFTCIALDYTLRIPASQSVEFAMNESLPEGIPITVHWGKHPEYQDIWAGQLKTWLHNILWPGFVDFVERQNLRFGDQNLKRLTDAMRNAYAHAGVMKWPNQRPASNWHGIYIDKSVHNKNVHEVIGYSDVIAMMLLICDDMARLRRN